MSLKGLVIRALNRQGYELRKILRPRVGEQPATYPFARRVKLGEISFDIWISNPDTSAWFQSAFQKTADFQAYVSMVKKGERVLDIGAHQGFHSLVLHDLALPGGFVLGVEAHPQNAMVAQAQIGLNNIQGSLRFLNAAASDRSGTATMTKDHNSQVASGRETDGYVVPTIVGDQLDEAFGEFTFVKIDVEGFEQRVLMGCRRILARKPKLALEIHLNALSRYGSSVNEVLDLVGVEAYRGFMNVRDQGRQELLTFEKGIIPKRGIVNLFLEPR